MDKLTIMSILIDFYGKLLTSKQYEIMDLYYNNDYSLAEISENLGISRQGVFDSLKRSQKVLETYENKLQLLEKFNKQKRNIKEVLEKLVMLKDNDLSNETSNNELLSIINSLELLLNDNE